MINKEFIEEYSLFRRFKPKEISEDFRMWEKIPINMSCDVCKSRQTFNMTTEYYHDGQKLQFNPRNHVKDLRFLCQSCKVFQRCFFICINEELDAMYKVGQYPEWEIKMDRNLEKSLNKHANTFRKGLVCESQGYGIGAFSYYRRITEEIIDELLDSILDLIEEENRAEYILALEKTKKTRITQEKINLVKDLLPPILKPNGMNPLGVLHSELSEGLHAATDDDCLEIAYHIKSILIFLINQIIESKEYAKAFTVSMKSLLEKRKVKK